MAETPSALAHQFDDLDQQQEAASLGMWLFLLTEIMFFGGLFTGYAVYRHKYYAAFAEASHSIAISWGALNTAVLIFSSLTMAMAVHAAQLGKRKQVILFLLLTILLGGVFLGIKAIEYHDKYEHSHIPGSVIGKPFAFHTEHPGVDPKNVELFFVFYFAMTGMHALHMVIGVVLLSVLVWMAAKNRFSAEYYSPVEMIGLYWHFVDIVWIFLFPLLYLIGRHGA